MPVWEIIQFYSHACFLSRLTFDMFMNQDIWCKFIRSLIPIIGVFVCFVFWFLLFVVLFSKTGFFLCSPGCFKTYSVDLELLFLNSVSVCILLHLLCVCTQRITCRNLFSSFTMWIPGFHSVHHLIHFKLWILRGVRLPQHQLVAESSFSSVCISFCVFVENRQQMSIFEGFLAVNFCMDAGNFDGNSCAMLISGANDN